MSAKIHRPLNGIEAAQLVGQRVTEALLARPEFTGHTTFINLKFIGGVKVKGDLRKEISAKVSSAEVFDAEVTFEQGPDNPEKLRQEIKAEPPVVYTNPSGPEILKELEVASSTDRIHIKLEVDDPAKVESLAVTMDDRAESSTNRFAHDKAGAADPDVPIPEILAEHTPETTGEPEPLDRATEPCQFCDYQVQVKGIGRSAHYRTHVKSGVAEEYEEGGIKHWRVKQ